jgi:hypothetical protein
VSQSFTQILDGRQRSSASYAHRNVSRRLSAAAPAAAPAQRQTCCAQETEHHHFQSQHASSPTQSASVPAVGIAGTQAGRGGAGLADLSGQVKTPFMTCGGRGGREHEHTHERPGVGYTQQSP